MRVVLSEQVLLRPVGGPLLMRQQLEQIAMMVRNDLITVDLQVAPLSLVSEAVLGGPFAVLRFEDPLDQDVVYLEGRDGALYVETRHGVERYVRRFLDLQSASLDPESSIRRIAEAAHGMR